MYNKVAHLVHDRSRATLWVGLLMSGSVLIFYTKKDLLHVTMNNQSHYFRVLESVITELTNDTDLKFLTSSFTTLLLQHVMSNGTK